MRRIVGRTGWLDRIAVALLLVEAAILVASLRQAMHLPFWYNEQWRAWHIARGRGRHAGVATGRFVNSTRAFALCGA
jgi:hypothetical protein